MNKMKALLLSAATLSGWQYAYAQEDTETEASSGSRLDTIVVSAQRREQDLLDVPVAVTAFDAEALEAKGVTDVVDLNLANPSFYMNTLQERTGNAPVRIRGVGTIGSNPAFEGAVGIYIDDIYRSRSGMALSTFTDVESVEILRGPQGTLFGKNTVAGALVLRSAAPDFDEFSASVDLQFANYNSQKYEGYVNIPVNDSLAFRFSGLLETSDGWFENPVTGEDTNPVDQSSIRAQVAFAPNDRLSGRLIIDRNTADGPYGYGRSTRLDNTDLDGSQNGLFGPAALNALPGPAPGVPLSAILPGVDGGLGYWFWDLGTAENGFADAGPTDPFSYEIGINQNGDTEVQDQGASLTLEYELTDSLSIKSVTSYREFSEDSLNADWDFSALDFGGGLDLQYDFETFSQEILLNGSFEFGDVQSLEFVTGAHYFDESWTYERRARGGDQLGPVYALALGGAGLLNFAELGACPEVNPALGCFSVAQVAAPGENFQDGLFDVGEESFGLFGHATYTVLDQLSFIGGLRFNSIEKTGQFTRRINGQATDAATYFNYTLGNALLFALNGAALMGSDFEQSTKDEELTYSGAVQFRPTPDSQIYASYSRGFKAGGVNIEVAAAGGAPSLAGTPTEVAPGVFLPLTPATPENTTYDPEFVDSYEIGYRLEYGGIGRMGLTAFRSEYEDLQLTIFTGTEFVVFNTGTSTVQGLEFENTTALTDNLTVDLSVTWLETAEFGGDIDPRLAAGRRRGQAPEFAFALGGQYERPVTEAIDMYVNLNWAYNGDHFLSDEGAALADVEQEAFSVVNASFGLRDIGNWDAQLFCTNCFEEEYFSYAFNHPFVAGGSPMVNPEAPRVYGISLKKDF